MSLIWETIIVNPIFNLLAVFYSLTQNLGWAIIVFTIIIKVLLIPMTLPSIKMSKKQREIQPELEKIKEKYKHDKQKLAQEQMKLMTKHGINPGAGCLTTIVTIVIMLAIYRVVNVFTLSQGIDEINRHLYFPSLQFSSADQVNTSFLYLDLTKPDRLLIIPVLAVLLQFLVTKMMMPYTKIADKAVTVTKGKSDDIMETMQKQNLYVMPLMFFFFGLTLPSGVMLYIMISTLAQILQTYYFSGWGGLEPWIKKLKPATK